MFGHLSFSSDGFLQVAIPMWDPRQAVVISEAGRAKRGALLTRVASLPAGEQRNRLYIGVSAALVHVPDDFVNYAIDVGITHFSLPTQELDQRTREINAQVDAEFDAADVNANASIASIVKCLKAIGYLRWGPDLDMFVRHWCTQVREQLSDPKLGVVLPLRGAMQTLFAIAGRTQDATVQRALVNVVPRALQSARPNEIPMLLGALQTVMSRVQGGSLMVELQGALTTTTLPLPYWATALRDALTQAAADPVLTSAAVAQTAFARASQRLEEDDAVTAWVSVQAIEAGQALGEFTETSRQTLARIKAERLASEESALQTLLRIGHQERDRQLEAARLRPHTPSITLPAGGAAEAAAAEREAVQRLSLGQLLRWIEGPVAGPRRRRLDPAATLARVKAQRVPAVRSAGGVQVAPVDRRPEAPAEPEPTAQDILTVAAQGYAAAAAFLCDEIRDMLPLAEQLQLPKEVIAHTLALAENLERLGGALEQSSDHFDEEATQLELSKADAGLSSLRGQLAQQKADVQRKTQFLNALTAALAQEALRLDRRDGGQVPCPLQPTDWAWVADLCHGRWLSGVRRILVDGKLTDLGSDEALALHVTGSSRSRDAYVFNVSVHLWRRDHGNTSLPSTRLPRAGGETWPPMNTDAWFDTYRTCCVLHVPKG